VHQDRDDAVRTTADLVLGYQTPRSGRMFTVASCADAGEAELVCGELRSAGIPAVALNQHTAALGPYAGGSHVEVRVPVEDRDRAAEVMSRLPDRADLEPEPEPSDGSADFATDDSGARVALAVVATYPTSRQMLEAAAALGSARVKSYLPNLVPRDPARDGPPPIFRVQVAQEHLRRAQALLEELDDPDEPRCPQCASWRVHPQGGSLLSWIVGLFGGGGVADGVKRMQCLSCGHPFAWGNPSGTFEVVQRRSGDGEATPPPATGP